MLNIGFDTLSGKCVQINWWFESDLTGNALEKGWENMFSALSAEEDCKAISQCCADSAHWKMGMRCFLKKAAEK